MNSLTSSCFFFYLLITRTIVTNFNIPFGIGQKLSNNNFLVTEPKCAVNLGKTLFSYNISGLYIDATEDIILNCSITLSRNDLRSADLDIDIGFEKGSSLQIDTFPSNGTVSQCEANSGILKIANFTPKIFNIKMSSVGHSNFQLLSLVTPFINNLLKEEVESFYTNLTLMLSNFTPRNYEPFPEYIPGLLKTKDWALGKSLVSVLNNFPKIFDSKFNGNFPTDNSIKVGTSTFAEDYKGGNYEIIISPQMDLTATIVFPTLYCDDSGFKCNATKGVGLFNFHTQNANSYTIPLIDNFLTPKLTNIINKYFGYNEKPFEINLPYKTPHIYPPVWVFGFFIPFFAICIILSLYYSIKLNKKDPAVCDETGEPISLRRIIIEDLILTFTVFLCIFMFICSNTTDLTSFYVGKNFPYKTISLTETIKDLYDLNYRFLAVFIAFFSAAYPYVKLIGIYVFCLLYRHPQSRVLKLIDNFGRFSLLDIFIITFSKTAMQIDGVININFNLSFNLFISATIFSIFVGNYATHRWRYHTSIRKVNIFDRVYVIRSEANDDNMTEPIDDNMTVPKEGIENNNNNNSNSNNQISDNITFKKMRKEWFEIWEWKLGAPGLIVVIVVSFLICYFTVFKYTMGGFASKVLPIHSHYNFLTILVDSNKYLATVGIITVIIAPAIYIISFPFTHFLAAWCATDVFLVAALCTMSVETVITADFIKKGFIIYTMTCALNWQIVFLLISSLVQWFFILKHNLSIPGIPTWKKIKAAFKKE